MVYGRALVKAQQYLATSIPPYARVLIVGGGTGWVLEEIAKVYHSGLYITYIDSSPKMIALAKKRNAVENMVTFIAAPIETIVADDVYDVYDVVFTPFLFDNFTDDSLRKIFSLIDKRLVKDGSWLYCDFQNTDVFWQKALLKVMYFFFRTICGIAANELPDAVGCFASYGYQVKEQKTFMSNFVVSSIYKKV